MILSIKKIKLKKIFQQELSLEEDVYEKIVRYYEISDKIKDEILKLDDVDDETKNNVLMPIPPTIKDTADKLLDLYIKFLKDIKDSALKNEITTTLDNLLEQIYKYKNIIYDLYRNKQ